MDDNPCGRGGCILGTVKVEDTDHLICDDDVVPLCIKVVDYYRSWSERPTVHPHLKEVLDKMDEWELFLWHAEIFNYCPNCGVMNDKEKMRYLYLLRKNS